MSPVALLTVLAVSFLLGPAAFLVLWLVWRRNGEPALRPLGLCVLGLCLILAGNTATLVTTDILRMNDDRLALILLDAVFWATALVAASLGRFACLATGKEVTVRLQVLFWLVTAAAHFLSLGLAVGTGYLVATCYGTAGLAWAAVTLWRRRERLGPLYAPLVPPVALGLLCLSVVSVGNDIFNFGRLLGGTGFPFSPLFFILTCLAIIVLCARELSRPAETVPPSGVPLSVPLSVPGLSEREEEVLALLLQGLSNEAIAQQLFISPHTVKNHVTNIYRKAGVSSRTALLAARAEPKGTS